MPPLSKEFAINASNYRHWSAAVRVWFDDCIAGAEGPRGRNFNMRWIASMAAEAHRILMRGGVYFYPGDTRPGYGGGRLRLVYEANPVGFLIEQAGGRRLRPAPSRILDRVPRTLHERVPLLFGSRDEVARFECIISVRHSPAKARPCRPRGLFGHDLEPSMAPARSFRVDQASHHFR